MDQARSGVLGTLLGSVDAAGGGLAVLFIVALCFGIVALGAVYVGSAMVVLERFARVARRARSVALCAAALAVGASVLILHESQPEAAADAWSAWWTALSPVLLRTTLLTALCCAVMLAAMRWLSTRQLGHCVFVSVAACLAAIAGATGGPVGALPPILLLALPALVLRGRRLRGAGGAGAGAIDTMGSAEWRFSAMAVVSCGGLLVALSPASGADLALGAARSSLGGLALLVPFGLVPLAAAGFLDMRGSPEWFIAVRYLVAKRRQVFISAITGICVIGIAAGVWLIIVVLSVMNGFEQTWRDEILGNRAHFLVQNGMGSFGEYDSIVDRVRTVPGVVAASPFIDADAMVRGRSGEIYTVRVRGVDPLRIGDVTKLEDEMLSGSLDALVVPSPDAALLEEEVDADPAGAAPAEPPMLIGHQLAASLGVGVGDDLLLISPFGGPPTPLGPAPRLSRFRVAGVFRSSFYQYDEVYTYVSIPAAQTFRRAGPVIDGIEAVTTDYYRSQTVGDRVADELAFPFYTKDWKEYFPAFFQALKTERVMMFLLLTMIMVVAAFVIVATLIMMIMEKSSDIAILKAMGAEDALIERIFALEGALIGVVGTGLGVVAGLAVTHRLSWIQDQIEQITGVDTLPTTVYQLSTLPSRVDPQQVAAVIAIAMILSLGATLLPSRQGARLDPAEGLRHE